MRIQFYNTPELPQTTDYFDNEEVDDDSTQVELSEDDVAYFDFSDYPLNEVVASIDYAMRQNQATVAAKSHLLDIINECGFGTAIGEDILPMAQRIKLAVAELQGVDKERLMNFANHLEQLCQNHLNCEVDLVFHDSDEKAWLGFV